MNNDYIVGSTINAWCTKCKLELVHTIVALVDSLPKKVKCNTCGGEHNFQGKSVETLPGKPKNNSRKTKSLEANFNTFNTLLTGRDPAQAKRYEIGGNYQKDELIEHPLFGTGVVSSIIQSNKIEIFFKEGPKLLIQNHSA